MNTFLRVSDQFSCRILLTRFCPVCPPPLLQKPTSTHAHCPWPCIMYCWMLEQKGVIHKPRGYFNPLLPSCTLLLNLANPSPQLSTWFINVPRSKFTNILEINLIGRKARLCSNIKTFSILSSVFWHFQSYFQSNKLNWVCINIMYTRAFLFYTAFYLFSNYYFFKL